MRWSLPCPGFHSRSLRLGRSLLRGLLLVFLAPVVSALVFAQDGFLWDGADQNPTVLPPRQPTFYHLPAGGSLTLALVAHDGRQPEVLIETSAPRAEIAVLAPEGRAFKTVSAEQPGWYVITFPSSQSRPYRLSIRAKAGGDADRGISFHVELVECASATAGSQTRAAAHFSAARMLSGSPQSAPLYAAIAQYRQAFEASAAAGDREGQILSLYGEAQAWLDLSSFDNALAALNRARSRSVGMPLFRASLANLAIQVYLYRMDSEPARRLAKEALALSRFLKDDWLRAEALAGLGESEYLTADAAERKDVEEAIALSRENHATETLARSLRCFAWEEKDDGRLTHAMALMREAEQQFRNAGDERNALDVMSNFATIQGMDGDHYAAVVRQSGLLPLMRDAGMQAGSAFLLVNIADDYAGLNRASDAIAYYRQSIDAFHAVKLLSGEAIGLSQLCVVEINSNRLKEAMRDCLRSKAMAVELHDPKRIALTVWRLGKVERATDQIALAIASFRSACETSESIGDSRTEAKSLIDWGDTLESSGNHAAARALFDKALPLSQAAEDAPGQIEARYRIARAEFEAGEDENAKHDLKISLDMIEAQRRAVSDADLQASYFAQMRKCHELFVELLMREARRDPSSDWAAQALEINESGRALTLLDALAARGDNQESRSQARASQELMELHMAVERAYDQRLKLMLGNGQKRGLDANATELTQAIDTLERAEDEQKAAAGSLAVSGRPLKAFEIVAASRNLQSTLVEYALGSEHSYVWVIDNGRIESHVLPARESIESEIGRWRKLATARIPRPGESFDDHLKRVQVGDMDLPGLSAQLSCTLLAPFLSPAMKHLTIVPDGDLELLPLEALPENGCQGGGQPLVADHQVVLAPSLSVLMARRDPSAQASRRGEVAILADPVFDGDDPRVHRGLGSLASKDVVPFGPALPRLRGTRDEAKAIAALAGPGRTALNLDFDASMQTLLSPSLSQYKILHLATHGILDQSMPGFSGIVLSLVDQNGRPVSGYLKTHDIANLELHSDLVVLSSCDSAAGVNLNGEGVTGLGHAFLNAGAKQVVSTLWSVDDETSKELMISFYTGMLRDGLNPSEALRRSQLKIMLNSRTAAPYYWAAFIVTLTSF